ncbi:GntR family transcriptional regulator [Heyndrickxia shackletonii]|uniref:GntR family transcriptional regulator n=1 Tax=Heyndrickxia shackletonii TaxID=157838 RepID=A0A0Q3WW17_9BACI|nr:GntR family transcriptional regulator [Heyndrickxia shackletonii]KQL52895.1 GntR family transcriptional regulator [Heyndrickxia shackletonii]NEY98927.1 GntR family transcriptional regulator [Heyndrickxia shackletonii]
MKPLQYDSVIPLYHQLKERLKESIDGGYWMPGDKIPSENQLMDQYSVSRNTAKKAIEELVQEGSLYRIQGKGTFVAKPKLQQSLMGFYSFSKVLKEKGMNPKDIILAINEVTPTTKVKEGLQLTDDNDVIEVKRLRCADDEPYILESSYIPKSIISDKEMLKKVGPISLYDLLEQEFNIVVTRAKEAFEPVLIRGEESKYLQTREGLPALLLERIAYDAKGLPVEFCHSIVRGDRCRFYTELT